MEHYQFSEPLRHSEGDMGKERPQKAYEVNLKKLSIENFFRTQFSGAVLTQFIET